MKTLPFVFFCLIFSLSAYSQEKECMGVCFDSLLPQQILPLFFDSQEMHGTTVSWKPNFEERLMFWGTSQSYYENNNVETFMDTVFYYQEKNHRYAVAVFVSSDGSACHACAPIIGLALFKRVAAAWSLQTFKKLYTSHGRWGEKEEILLQQIGGRFHVLVFNSHDSGLGEEHQYYELVHINHDTYTSPFSLIFSEQVYYSNAGNFFKDDAGYEYWERVITFAPNGDMSVVFMSNKQPNTQTIYRFDGREYYPVKN